MSTRTEHDLLGYLDVPADAYYGVHTARAVDNFPISGLEKVWPDRLMERPTLLGIESLSADGVTIRMVVRTPPTKRWDVVREWRRRIKEAGKRTQTG